MFHSNPCPPPPLTCLLTVPGGATKQHSTCISYIASHHYRQFTEQQATKSDLPGLCCAMMYVMSCCWGQRKRVGSCCGRLHSSTRSLPDLTTTKTFASEINSNTRRPWFKNPAARLLFILCCGNWRTKLRPVGVFYLFNKIWIIRSNIMTQYI